MNETQITKKTFEQFDAADLPNRYSIRGKGEERVLVCSESPTISVRIRRGMSVSAVAALKAPSGTIYLDGAAQGGPFLNIEKDLLNLDHHEGCVRAFTVATCEQAMVVVRRGLDLQRRDWVIWANEPDLDTILAIWILLNHLRLNDADPEIRTKVMPLVRLEGAIDAHGLEMQELCGFPPEIQASVIGDLERLRSREVELKKEAKWQEIDFLEYAADILRALDAMIYSSRHFEEVVDVEELARAVIGDNQLAIVCRSDRGIYELEPHLRRLHGKRLGVIILQKDSKTYTLRLVNPFLPATLDRVYERLNLVDPSAGRWRSANRWGGSGEIGGSPRATGTGLTPQQIAQAFAQAYVRPTARQRFGAVALALLLTLGVMGGSILVTYILGWLQHPGGSIESYFQGRAEIFFWGTRGAQRGACPCGFAKGAEAFRTLHADRIRLAASVSLRPAGRACRRRLDSGWLAVVVSTLCPPSLDRVCHSHGRSDCFRDPIPWDRARYHRAKLPNSAYRRPLVSLLACAPLKLALRPMVFVPPSPLPRPGCGAKLYRRPPLWNQQRDDPRTFGEPTSLFHSPLVLRDHHTPGIAAILPGSPRYAPKTPSTIGSNLLILPLHLLRTWLTQY